jgi:hypothetical protein
MDPLVPTVLIPASTAVGVLFALILWQRVSKVKVGAASSANGASEYLLEEGGDGGVSIPGARRQSPAPG